jgi:hypothetical protein
MNTFLSVLALMVSGGILIVHYRNQVERRHSEIIQLKTQIMSSFRNQQLRYVSILTNCEVIRIELRRLPDNEDKYKSIERFPGVLERYSKIKDSIDEQIKKLDKIDTHKINRSAVLINLQSLAATAELQATSANEAENEILEMLKSIREQLKA